MITRRGNEGIQGGTGKRWRIFDESWLRNRQWRFFHRFDTMILWSKYQRSCPEIWISLERGQIQPDYGREPTRSQHKAVCLLWNYTVIITRAEHCTFTKISGWTCQQQTVKDLIFVKLSLNDRAISVFSNHKRAHALTGPMWWRWANLRPSGDLRAHWIHLIPWALQW